MSKKQTKIVYIDSQNVNEIRECVNSIPYFRCSMNRKQADIIITKNPHSEKEMTFDTFKSLYKYE